MKCLKRLETDSGNIIVEVIQVEHGVFMIKRYARKYDEEEGGFYVAEIGPASSSRYSDIESAICEAERLIELS